MAYKLGVLAGMGPRSTGPFVDMLVNSCQSLYGAKHDADFPLMHIISLPTPFYAGRPVDDTGMIKALKSGITLLKNSEVDVIVVPCNLAHCYFNEMVEVSDGIPVLNIISCSIAKLPESLSKIVVLATEQTLNSGLYQEEINRIGKVFIQSQSLDESVFELIRLVKEYGYSDVRVRKGWMNIVDCIEQLDVDGVIVACTDISPLIYDDNNQNVIIVDTAQSLADTAITLYLENIR